MLHTGGFDPALSLLAAVMAFPLGCYAIQHIGWQQTMPSHEVHAMLHQWSGMAVFAVTLVLFTLVVARRPSGWVAGAVVSEPFSQASAPTSLLATGVPSGLGPVAAAAALAGGVVFAATAASTARRIRTQLGVEPDCLRVGRDPGASRT